MAIRVPLSDDCPKLAFPPVSDANSPTFQVSGAGVELVLVEDWLQPDSNPTASIPRNGATEAILISFFPCSKPPT